MKLSERVLSTEHGLLIRSVQLSDQGLYYCLTTENSFKRTVAKIRLRVLSEAMVTMLTDKQQSPWAWASSLHPKVLLAAFSPAESLAVQQYCKERKEFQKLQQRQQQPLPPGPLRGDLAKLKPLLDRRKSRNRRNHLREIWHRELPAAETDMHTSLCFCTQIPVSQLSSQPTELHCGCTVRQGQRCGDVIFKYLLYLHEELWPDDCDTPIYTQSRPKAFSLSSQSPNWRCAVVSATKDCGLILSMMTHLETAVVDVIIL